MVILVAEAIAHGEVRTNLPFVLGIADYVVLLNETVSSGSIIKRVRCAGVAENLNPSRSIGQETRYVREGVGGPTQPVGVDAYRPQLEAELHRMVLVRDIEAVDIRQRVRRVRL